MYLKLWKTLSGQRGTLYRIYPLTDPLGNVRFITNNTGTLVARYSYDPYGTIRKKEGTVNSTFTFSGEQLDPETSLTFLRARYYDSATGTFLSRDPVLGPLEIPIEHGEYLYARNNPINLSDPSGELVEIVARRVSNNFLGDTLKGIHYYVDIKPEQPEDFSCLGDMASRFTLSGTRDERGHLVKTSLGYESWYSDEEELMREPINWTWIADSETEFINRLLGIRDRYGDNLAYAWPTGFTSNTFAYNVLRQGGINPDVLARLPNPKGWAPGWGLRVNLTP